jgi:hypothetical protein
LGQSWARWIQSSWSTTLKPTLIIPDTLSTYRGNFEKRIMYTILRAINNSDTPWWLL